MATDPHTRLLGLADSLEPRLRRRFLDLVREVQDTVPVEEAADLLEAGFADRAIERMERASSVFASAVAAGAVSAGQDTASTISRMVGGTVDFDQFDPRAVERIRSMRLRIVQGLSEQQRQAVQTAVAEGVERGLNPRGQARLVRGAIGLTSRQLQTVRNYRNLLENNSSEALRRTLRDRRFDSTVADAVRTGEPLSEEQIDRMVERYRQRMLAFRADTIARTEALRAVHEGNDEAYAQAVDAAHVRGDDIVRTWHTAADERVRHSHAVMNGQTQRGETPFVSGNGALLRYPHDPRAPASETVNCRCAVTTEITEVEEETPT